MSDRLDSFRADVADAVAGAPDTRGLWLGLGRTGVLAGLYPATDHRSGTVVDSGRLAALLEELDRRLPVGPVLAVCVQVATVIPVLAGVADTSPLADKVLAQALRGEVVVALAATDAGLSGSALLDSRTELRDGGTGVVLHGGKDWICNAGHCDYALVLARHRPARHFTSFSWVLVPAGSPGMSWQPATTSHFDGAALGHLRWNAVPLPREFVVGRQGRAMAEFARQIGVERLAGALWARVLCRRALVDTYHHLATRSTGAGTLWDNAAIRERFARCLVQWRLLDALCDIHCATQGGAVVAASDAMVLKVAGAVSVDRILAECVQLGGADSFADGGMASLREHATMFGIAGGATGALLAGIAADAEQMLSVAGVARETGASCRHRA